MADRKITALTELTAPVAADVFPVVDVSESANASKNKKIQLTTVLKNIPDGNVSAPSVGFTSDSGLTGFFRVASNEIGVSANQTLIGSFSTTGFQLGSGTPAAQLHLFSTDTTDQVIIENSDTGADNAPDLVLFRNSASPAADDNLGNLVYRGEDSAGNAHDYASVVASIEDTTNGSEDGILDIMSSAAGTLASRIRLKNNLVGIHESDPAFPLHLTTTAAGQAFQIECNANDAASGADLMLYHRRGASGAGQDNDVLSTIIYKGKNDAGTPEEVNYAAIESVIVDASDATEDGKLNLQVMTAGTLTTKVAIDASGIDVTGTITDDGAVHDGDVTFTGASANIVFDKSDNALEFADNAKATFGADSDLQIFHDGSHSVIKDDGTGVLKLLGSSTFIKNNTDDKMSANFVPTSACNFFFNGSKKLETASYGILATGTIVTTTGNVRCQSDSHKITAGAGNDLTAFHDGTDSFIENTNGNLHIRPKSSEEGIKLIPDGSVEIYHDNVKKCSTSADGLDFPDNSKLQLGDSQDALIYHSGSSLNIDNNTGNIFYDTVGTHYFRVGGGNETAIQAAANGSVDLYFDNVLKAQTSSDGFDIPADSAKLKIGQSGDLTFFHDGSNSHIKNNTGDLVFSDTNHVYIRGYTSDKSVGLFFNGSQKVVTSSDGLDFPDNSKLQLGDSQDLQIFHDSGNSVIKDNGTGQLKILGSTVSIKNGSDNKTMASFLPNGASFLNFNGVNKLETTSSGVTVTGTVTETSDIAFKSEIKPITNTLDKLQQITGYKYKLDNASIDSMGVIAQDVEKVFPELVHGDEGSKTLQYSGLIGVLVEAVKDLSAKVKALESS